MEGQSERCNSGMKWGESTSALRALREAQGMGIKELARRAQVDVGYLSKIERGLVTPSLGTLLRLLTALGLRDGERWLRHLLGRGTRP